MSKIKMIEHSGIEGHIASEEIKEYIGKLQEVTLTKNRMTLMVIVLEVIGSSLEEVASKSRVQEIAMRRHLFCFLIYNLTTMSLIELSRIINRDHSTMINSRRAIVDELNTNKQYARDILLLLEELYGIFTEESKSAN